MFYAGWIALTATGILAGLAVFVWALKNGQLQDQGRARFIPLLDAQDGPTPSNPSKITKEVWVLMGVAAIVFGAMACAVIMTIVREYG